ncbi:hypothetical protein [Butyrivibrio sp. NC2002]|uniref:hypothetical protein n=1 Tax=Butyrivibrio sp. NC2002 TaxID=1410610 RepID=UPI000569747C|nr:hypothetical protein [Butyrivibrio sp. NC2002]
MAVKLKKEDHVKLAERVNEEFDKTIIIEHAYKMDYRLKTFVYVTNSEKSDMTETLRTMLLRDALKIDKNGNINPSKVNDYFVALGMQSGLSEHGYLTKLQDEPEVVGDSMAYTSQLPKLMLEELINLIKDDETVAKYNETAEPDNKITEESIRKAFDEGRNGYIGVNSAEELFADAKKIEEKAAIDAFGSIEAAKTKQKNSRISYIVNEAKKDISDKFGDVYKKIEDNYVKEAAQPHKEEIKEENKEEKKEEKKEAAQNNKDNPKKEEKKPEAKKRPKPKKKAPVNEEKAFDINEYDFSEVGNGNISIDLDNLEGFKKERVKAKKDEKEYGIKRHYDDDFDVSLGKTKEVTNHFKKTIDKQKPDYENRQKIKNTGTYKNVESFKKLQNEIDNHDFHAKNREKYLSDNADYINSLMRPLYNAYQYGVHQNSQKYFRVLEEKVNNLSGMYLGVKNGKIDHDAAIKIFDDAINECDRYVNKRSWGIFNFIKKWNNPQGYERMERTIQLRDEIQQLKNEYLREESLDNLEKKVNVLKNSDFEKLSLNEIRERTQEITTYKNKYCSFGSELDSKHMDAVKCAEDIFSDINRLYPEFGNPVNGNILQNKTTTDRMYAEAEISNQVRQQTFEELTKFNNRKNENKREIHKARKQGKYDYRDGLEELKDISKEKQNVKSKGTEDLKERTSNRLSL